MIFASPRIALNKVDLPHPTGPMTIVSFEQPNAKLAFCRIGSVSSAAAIEALINSTAQWSDVELLATVTALGSWSSSTGPSSLIECDDEPELLALELPSIFLTSVLSLRSKNSCILPIQPKIDAKIGTATINNIKGAETSEMMDSVVNASAADNVPEKVVQ